MMQMTIPAPEAFITVVNVGKYKTKGVSWVRTAVIVSPPVLPDGEEALFNQADWQTGGLLELNPWYPGDPRTVHTHYNAMLASMDWNAIVEGKKGFYVLTKAWFGDIKGAVPPTESCTYWWYENHEQKSQWCIAHNS